MNIMKWISCLLLLIVTGCTSNEVSLDDVILSTGSLDNYTNESNSYLTLNDGEYSMNIINKTAFVDNEAEIDTKTLVNDATYSACTIYIEADNIYVSCDGTTPYYYENTIESYNNMNDLTFSDSDIKSKTASDNVYTLIMTDDYAKTVLEDNGLVIDSLNSITNTMTIKVEDGIMVSQIFDVSFDCIYDEENIIGNYEYSSAYSEIGTTAYTSPDKSLYVPLEEDVVTLDDVKEMLVSELGYEAMDNGTYETDFNTNEAYIFDFDNHIFTYLYAGVSYSYNYSADIGTAEGCLYNFDSEEAASCTEDEIESIKEAKQDYCIELGMIGLTEMPEE